MKNVFPIIIVALFFLASCVEMIGSNVWKSLFYLFSALINIATIML